MAAQALEIFQLQLQSVGHMYYWHHWRSLVAAQSHTEVMRKLQPDIWVHLFCFSEVYRAYNKYWMVSILLTLQTNNVFF